MLISSDDRLSFEKSRPGRRGVDLPKERFCAADPLGNVPQNLKRQGPALFPEMSEPEVVRHFINLSRKNFSVDTHFYPLGSCTMKYNPKVNEWAARQEKFTALHPLQSQETTQGMLEILWGLEESLKEISGMDRFTMQPAAGAHGELTGMMLVRAYHASRGDAHRTKVLVPDSSHGTNPASAALLGYHVVEVKSNSHGCVDLEDLKRHLDEHVACLMLTNPNTLGLFEKNILEITRLVHEKGGLLYYDGANLNPLLGIARPGDMGFDIIHINLHKTFSTPHGGGGPGSGPVGVKKHLVPFLPSPLVGKTKDGYVWEKRSPQSVGRVKSFHGNIGVIIRAYAYLRSIGREGLRQVSEAAILNANYLRVKLKDTFCVAVNDPCLHEFVLNLSAFGAQGVHAGDIGKRLLDLGFHAPTVHFPLVVAEALMIEPTETETQETLDQFVSAMKQIAREIETDPAIVKNAPHTLPVRRPNDVLAARKPILSYRDMVREKVLAAEVAA
ncbi:MAG TPA: aminomethyl-transferring glycine dehydrogenase subunit GcvPB [Candidatus Omnitrophota bacterium]|nr:aminomethyl-transferring glycine dehydrogenase subunit GcvPB [Candidatus Omnitrophota bacterium]HPS36746.1 aminomethyl-transferring glycine dehydrogenase subunit GcvPB [Candidatus Omnitrophota bacterium]